MKDETEPCQDCLNPEGHNTGFFGGGDSGAACQCWRGQDRVAELRRLVVSRLRPGAQIEGDSIPEGVA